MKILIVEDEPHIATGLEVFLSLEFPGAEIETLTSESAFLCSLPEIVAKPPDFAVVDLMLAWGDSTPTAMDRSPYQGGVRIIDDLASRAETKSVPIILLSAAGHEHIRDQLRNPRPNVFLFSKPLDVVRFRTLIRSLLAASPGCHELPGGSAEIEAARVQKRIFVSYSHKDQKWMQELEITLRPMLRDGEFLLWNDSRIEAGNRWKSQIEAELSSASIAILLVSRYFFASDFIAKNELPPLLDRAARGGVRILWIAVSASDYERSKIATYQALNDPAHPLDSLKRSDLNKELVRIGKVVHELVEV